MAIARSEPFRVVVAAPSAITGLDFPGSTWTPEGDCRLTFHDPLPAYPATYLWECFPRRQKGFYTTFFWGPDGSPGADGFYPDRTYYGAHPYPAPRGDWDAFMEPPELAPGEGHAWEIAVEGGDIVGERVAYDRWYVQALRVRTEPSGRRFHEYFTDLTGPGYAPGAACAVSLGGPRIEYESSAFADPPSPGLVFGGAPWTSARGSEIWSGVLRGVRIYRSFLDDADLAVEACAPLASAGGAASIWYVRMSPTPDDLASDALPGGASGPTPIWSTARRATLWSG
jgi:hypothetical protein